MKRLLLIASLFLCAPMTSAQSMNSVLLQHVDQASLEVIDFSRALSTTQTDTLRQRLIRKLSLTEHPGDEEQRSMPVLSFIVERYEQKQGWYYITFRVELSETVRRLQEPSIITNAVTWKTRSTATFNARAYSLMEGTWQILDSVTETILAMHNEQDNAR